MNRDVMLGSLAIDHLSPETFQAQLYQRLRGMIRAGQLRPGDRLPSSRRLAEDIGVSRNTVTTVYARLASEGYIDTRHGIGTIVSDYVDKVSRQGQGAPATEAEMLPSYQVQEESLATMLSLFTSRPTLDERHSLRPFTPDVRQFPFKTWRHLMARRSMLIGDEDLFGYGWMTGYKRLRQSIADYVTVNRGVRCDWQQIIVTNGAQAALNLIARILVERGDTVWMEEPGYYWARFAFLSRGAEFVPMEVSPEGLWNTEPPQRPVKLIHVTPSCQHPLCKHMPLDVRQRLVDIAAETGAWIIEDDFGSELRMDQSYTPSLQGLDRHDRTIYVGSFSKSMFPALRIGYLVAPRQLVETIERTIFATGHVASLPPQAALSDFLEEGYFVRHLRRMRNLYAERREMFLELADTCLSEWMVPIEKTVGLQVPFLLKAGLTDDFAVQSAAKTLNMVRLSSQYFHGNPKHGLVLGYAALGEREMSACIGRLGSVLSGLQK